MEYCIYLKAKPCLSDFIKHLYGDPAVPEKDSPESRIIRKYLSKTPEGQLPDTAGDASLAVVIPRFGEMDRRACNHLGDKAKNLLPESFDQIIEKSMIDETGRMETYFSGRISPLIHSWMEKHGIEDNGTNRYTISQKYYRL